MCNCCCKPIIKEYKIYNGNTYKLYETCSYRCTYYSGDLNCKWHGKYKGVSSLYMSKKSPYMDGKQTECPKCKYEPSYLYCLYYNFKYLVRSIIRK